MTGTPPSFGRGNGHWQMTTENFDSLRETLLAEITEAADLDALEAIRVTALGKQGSKRNGPHRGNADCGQEPAWQTRSGRDEGRHHRPDIGFDG